LKVDEVMALVDQYKGENSSLRSEISAVRKEERYKAGRKVGKLKEEMLQQRTEFERKEFRYKLAIEKLRTRPSTATTPELAHINPSFTATPATTTPKPSEEELFAEIRELKSRLHTYY
jgi:hypothetical protein